MKKQVISNRYSDDALQAFKAHVEQKLGYAKDDYAFVTEQIKDQTEAIESEGDWMDSSSSTTDLELLYLMANRQRKHIDDLERALIRIEHKTYGVCQVTGELIDKRRLLAVPTTSKSLEAKLSGIPPIKIEEEKPKKVRTKQEPVIISRVIKRPTSKKAFDLEDDMEDVDYDFDNLNDNLAYETSDDDTDINDIVDPSSLE